MDTVTNLFSGPISNLFSGLIGAIVGAIVTIVLYWKDKKESSLSDLTEFVYVLGYRSWQTPENGKHGLIFLRHHPKLWSKYVNLRRHIGFWKRRSLDHFWHEYSGVREYDKIPNDHLGKLFFQGIPQNRDDAVKRSEQFIRHLQDLR